MANGDHGSILTAAGAVFTSLPGWGQVLAIIAMIAGVGAGASRATEDIRAVPERVTEIEERQRASTQTLGHEISNLSMQVHKNTDSLGNLSERIDLMICLQEASLGEHPYESCARK